MKKSIVTGLLAVVLVFLGWRSYISSHGKEYFQEYLDAAQRAQKGMARFELVEYKNGFSGAEATVKVHLLDGEDSPLKNPLEIRSRIEYGPVIFSGFDLGLMRIDAKKSLRELLKAEEAKTLESSIEKPVTISYRAVMDWTHVVHEETRISEITAKEGNRSLVSVAPIRIDGSYELSTLAGRWHFGSEKLVYRDFERKDRLTVLAPSIDAQLQSIDPDGLLFGRYRVAAKEIEFVAPGNGVTEPVRFTGALELGLQKKTEESVALELGLNLQSEDEATRKMWEGIRRLSLKLSMENLGLAGLKKLVALQKERQAIQKKLAAAVGRKDDIAMQKAILALQMLDDRWIELYNTLLIPGKTTLHIEEEIQGAKLSRLALDLRYTGRPLQGNAMSAMISLAAHADRLVEGSFDLTLEKALAKKLYPNGIFVLDSMVSKNLATLKEGLYHVKGEIKEGKIIINGTKYAPQELVMMILM